MNRVNDKVQELFASHEDRVRKRWQSERLDDVKYASEVLSELQLLREFWDRQGWAWEADRSLEQRSKRSFYLKMWDRVQNKLATRIETVENGDYWWKSPQHQEIVTLLWEISGVLRKAASPWWRHVAPVAWHVIKEVFILGLFVALLLSSRGTFETRVVALLVLVYSCVSSGLASLGFVFSSNQALTGDELRNVARSMKLKVPVTELAAAEKFGLGILVQHISGISGALGSVIGVAALIYSFF